jgi:hypothetical protein
VTPTVTGASSTFINQKCNALGGGAPPIAGPAPSATIGQASRVRIALAGESDRVTALAEALVAAGAELLRLTPPPTGATEDSSVGLATPLIEFEPRLDGAQGEPLDGVVLADSSDASLAAALVAAKVPLPLVTVDPPTAARGATATVNARLIEQLADGVPGADPAAIMAAIERASDRSGPHY